MGLFQKDKKTDQSSGRSWGTSWGGRDTYTGYRYGTYGTSYGSSSFWLDDDFFGAGGYGVKGFKPKSTHDVIKLASYKRAIANFVHIVTNDTSIEVKYSSGKQSYTNGKTVVISAKITDKQFDSTVGLALHEGSHIVKTTMSILDPSKNAATKKALERLAYIAYEECKRQGIVIGSSDIKKAVMKMILQPLINIIEDRRIDAWMYTTAAGYRGYYEALYDTYFLSKEIDKALEDQLFREPTIENYIFHICNFMNRKRTIDLLPGLHQIWDKIDLAHISRLNSTEEVLGIADECAEIILRNCTDLKKLVEVGNGKDEDEDEDKGDGEGEGNGDGDDDGDDDDMDGDPNLDHAGSGSGKPKSLKDLTPQQLKKLMKAIEKQKKFLEGKIKKEKLSEEMSRQIEAVADSNTSIKDTGKADLNGNKLRSTIQTIVVHGFSEGILTHTKLVSGHYYKGRSDGYVEKGIRLGVLLGKRLKTRDEDRQLKTTRMDAGHIDRRLIAELGFQNERVFQQTLHNISTPSIVHISIDASGSMQGRKWSRSMTTAIAIAKAASMIQSLDVVISLRGTAYTGSDHNPLMWVVYDSRKDKFNIIQKHFGALCANNGTPESLCYEAVEEEIIKAAKGKTAYFINFSDGEPGWSGGTGSFGGEYAILHCADMMKKFRNVGIEILSFYIEDGGSVLSNDFRRMYGKDASLIDESRLADLARALNKLFERNITAE